MISSTADKGTLPIPRIWGEATKIRAQKISKAHIQCHMVAETFVEQPYSIVYAGTYSERVYRTFNRLMQAGIAEFWESAQQNILIRISNMETTSTAGYTEEIEGAYMNSSIQSVLVIFLILQALNFLCFTGEVLSVRFLQRWNRWIIHRRYLRAIDVLGRI